MVKKADPDTSATTTADPSAIELEPRERDTRTATNLLNSLLDSATDAIWMRDADGRFQVANPAARAIMGRSLEDVIGHSVHEIFGDSIGDHLTDETRRIFAGGKPVTVEEQMFDVGNDRLTTFLSNKVPLYRDDGAPAGILGISRDISQRKRLEEDSRALADRQSFLLKLEDVLAPMDDPEAVKAAASELLGRKLAAGRVCYAEVDERIGEVRISNEFRQSGMPSGLGTFRLEDVPAILDVYRRGESLVIADNRIDPRTRDFVKTPQVAQTGTVAVLDAPLLKNGRLVGLLVTSHPEPRDWTPAEIRLVEAVAERTWSAVQRARAEQHERKAAVEFQTLADNIPTLCWMAHADGNVYWFNKRWYDYTGTRPDQQRGWGWESVHDPATLPAVLERWKHSIATGTEFEMTFPLRGADGVFRPFLTRVVPIRDDNGRIVRWFGSNTDVGELRASEARLATQIAELKALYDSAPIGLAFFSRDYRYLRINEELAAINGVPTEQHIGRTIREVLSDQAPEVEPIIDRIFATGEAMRDLEVSGETPQQPGILRHWLAGFYPVKDEDGAVEAVGAWVIEISERKAAEQREHLLAREVDHRAKNLLTVVQSVLQLTRAETVEELKESVIGRIQSLARAHALLANSRWEGVELTQLVKEELAPFTDAKLSQASVSGPEQLLRPAVAQSLALVLHELATNAVKYGALSASDGRIEIKWEVSGDPATLVLDWIEHATVPITEPTEAGFGTRIISASVERQLQGRVTQIWNPDGLHCRLEFKLRTATAPSEG